MLTTFMPRLIQDLELGNVTLASELPGTYKLPVDEGVSVHITSMANGFMLKCNVAPFPKKNEEAFSTQALLANLFGQGTRDAVLGQSMDGNTLVLTRVVDYPVEYREFREILEDFINSVDVWREEALKG